MALKFNIKMIAFIAFVVTVFLWILATTCTDIIKPALLTIGLHPSALNSNEDLFQKSTVSFQTVYHMRDSIVEYYEKSKSNCFIRGSTAIESSKCVCLPNWHGPTCDIPSEVFRSLVDLNRTIAQRRTRPRRIIFVLPINETLQLTLKMMHDLHDVVDVFVYGNTLDANSTQNQVFQNQSALDFKHQMLFVWNLEASDSSNSGWSKPFKDLVFRAFYRLSDVRMDDLVVLSRGFRSSCKHTLLFLKLHDNYPEQIILNYPKGPQSFHYVPWAVCTVGSLIKCCHFDISKLSAFGNTDPKSNLSTRWVMTPNR